MTGGGAAGRPSGTSRRRVLAATLAGAVAPLIPIRATRAEGPVPASTPENRPESGRDTGHDAGRNVGLDAGSNRSHDHDYAAWTALLRQHVVVLDGGRATRVHYAALKARRAPFDAVLQALSMVSAAAFEAFTPPQQQAFLINAYNAFTIELILTKYPALESIKDLGSLLSSPWKPKRIALLGRRVSLDGIEHGLLRARGRYDDPRVHFAVNCASIGCPALREEAYVAPRLDAQLDDQALRFMSDPSRNRWNPTRGRLELSRIFDWYGEDFRLGLRGIDSVAGFAARYADRLADAPADRERIRAGQVEIAWLDYDWSLNDAR